MKTETPYQKHFSLVGVGSVRLAGRCWLPPAPLGVVVFAHGLGEHGGEFQLFASELAGRGLAVVAVDHRGHGASQGPRHLIQRFDDLVDDFSLAVEYAATIFPASPLFAIGHSMGGLVVTRYAMRPENRLSGVVISSAALEVLDHYPAFVARGLVFLSRVLPRFPLLASAAPPHPRDPFGMTGYLPLATAREILLTGRITVEQAANLRIPVLFNHGGADDLTPLQGALRVYEACSSSDKTLLVWPERDHNLLHDTESLDVMERVAAWIVERTGGNGSDVRRTVRGRRHHPPW